MASVGVEVTPAAFPCAVSAVTACSGASLAMHVPKAPMSRPTAVAI